MMDNVVQYIINLIVFIPVTTILIVISIKLSKTNLSNLGGYKYVKVLEKTVLSKDTEVCVLKIGDEGCVLVSSPSKVENIKELSKEEIENIEQNQNDNKIKLVKLNKEAISLNKLKLKEINLQEVKLSKSNFKRIKSNKIKFNKSKSNKLSFNKLILKESKYGKLR